MVPRNAPQEQRGVGEHLLPERHGNKCINAQKPARILAIAQVAYGLAAQNGKLL